MSPQIQNEFINILGEEMRHQIISEVKKAEYYSIIFDSTPDISHKDQTSQVLRYIKIEDHHIKVVESFVDFIEMKDKTAEGIAEMILCKLKTDGLDIIDYRGQAYDNSCVLLSQ